jgi:hypothetical protein
LETVEKERHVIVYLLARQGIHINRKERVMRKYYYSNGKDREGPFTLDELKSVAGFSAESLVWYTGLSGWIRAGDLPELSSLGSAVGVVRKSSSGKAIKTILIITSIIIGLFALIVIFAPDEEDPSTVYYESSAPSSTPVVQGNSKRSDILKLLRLSDFTEGIKIIVDMFISVGQQLYPDASERYWESLKRKVCAEDDLRELSVTMFDKHCTHDEIKQLIRRWEDPSHPGISEALDDKLELIGQEISVMLGDRVEQKVAADLGPIEF